MSNEYYSLAPNGDIICHYRTPGSKNGYIGGVLKDASKVAKGKLNAAGNYIYENTNKIGQSASRFGNKVGSSAKAIGNYATADNKYQKRANAYQRKANKAGLKMAKNALGMKVNELGTKLHSAIATKALDAYSNSKRGTILSKVADKAIYNTGKNIGGYIKNLGEGSVNLYNYSSYQKSADKNRAKAKKVNTKNQTKLKKQLSKIWSK